MSAPTDLPLRTALVGYGYAGKTFHRPLLSATPGIELVAVVSGRPEVVRNELPRCEVLDFATVLLRPDIELVVIATPNATHHALARAALVAGKHVVVDKPCTLQAREARELVEIATATRRLLTVFHNRRWDSDFLTLQQLIERNELGRIVSLESRFDRHRPLVRDRWRERDEPGAGTWYDLGPHLVDQSLVLFGMPEAVCGYLDCQRDGAVTIDCFQVRLRYPRLSVVLASSYLAVAPAPRFRVFGVNGSYTKEGVDPQEAALARGEQPAIAATWGTDRVPGVVASAGAEGIHERVVASIPGNYLAFYSEVRAAVRDAAPPPVSGADIVAGIAILEAAITSSRTRQEVWMNQP